MAERFPQPDLATVVRAIPGTAYLPTPSAQPPTSASAECVHSPTNSLAPGPVVPLLASQVVPPQPSARITPRSPERYAIQLTVSRETHDRLRRVQGLLGHTVPSRDLETVFDRALVLLEKSLERQRFAATDRPGRSRQSKRARHVPAKVRRAVWARDGGQCTFTSDTGRRCESRTRIEFMRTLQLCSCFSGAPHKSQIFSVPMVRGRIVRIEFDGAAEFFLGAGLIPFVREFVHAERRVCFGQ